MTSNTKLTPYLNQAVSWQQKTGHDEFNHPIFNSTTIQTRKEARDRLLKNDLGETILSKSTFFCHHAIQINDWLDEMPVLQVYEMINRRGKIVGFEVLT